MPRTAIIDAQTRDILVLDPPTDQAGHPILPEGVNALAVTLSDAEAAKLSAPDARFTYSNNAVQVETVTQPAPEPTHDERIAASIAPLLAKGAGEIAGSDLRPLVLLLLGINPDDPDATGALDSAVAAVGAAAGQVGQVG